MKTPRRSATTPCACSPRWPACRWRRRVRVSLEELQMPTRGLPEYRAQINFPNPWPGGSWTLRDIVDYDLTAARGLLSATARYREDLHAELLPHGRARDRERLEGRPVRLHHPAGAARSIRGKQAAPAADRRRGRDPAIARAVPRRGYRLPCRHRSRPHGAAVSRLREDAARDSRSTRRRVCRPAAQPERPYDVAGWTLPMQMGVKVDRIEQTFEPPPSTRLAKPVDPAGNALG